MMPAVPSALRYVKQLSQREVEVWRHITSGLNSREIAEAMRLSQKTIDTYKEHLRSKLRVKSWSAAKMALLGLQHGLGTVKVEPALADLTGLTQEDQLVCINAVVFRREMEAAGVALDLERFKAQSRGRRSSKR